MVDEARQNPEGSVFADAFAQLDDAKFSRHFLHEKVVRHLHLPPATMAQIANADAIIGDQFTYIGEAHALPRDTSWKHNPSRDKEWQIAHHKFYFGVDLIQAYAATGHATYLQRWIELTASWLDEMGTGFIAASDAQVEAKRVESWITAYVLLLKLERPKLIPAGLLRRWLGRIAEEAHYITQNLKPSRNHRTFQLYAMFLAGVVFPEFRWAQPFVAEARSKLCENLLNDFAPGGVHIERSTHYHNITLETALSFVELARLNKIDAPPELCERLYSALLFAAYAQLPDGEIPLINDSDTLDHSGMFEAGFRLFRDPALQWVSSRGAQGAPLPTPSRDFDGYLILSDSWGQDPASFARRQHVFFDRAPLGAGSHSHYDLLSLCWFANGHPILVDPGRFTYDPEPDSAGIDWRGAFKSTAFHNTVEIDGKDQTRYRSKSKTPPPGVARYDKSRHTANHGPDVEIRGAAHHIGDYGDWAMATAASHEYRPLHTRAVVFLRRQYLVAFDHIDTVDGEEHAAVLRFHLAARWQRRVQFSATSRWAIARTDDWDIHTAMSGQGEAEMQDGWVSTSYGVKTSAPVLTFTQRSKRPMTFCSLLFPSNTVSKVRAFAPFQSDASSGVAAYRAEIEFGGDVHVDTFVFGHGQAGIHHDGNMRFEGRLLAYRQDQSGGLTYLHAAGPCRLKLPGDEHAVDRAGHIEWTAPHKA